MPTINAACSGSKIADVQHVKDTISQIPTVISLGVGGNDADLVGKLKSCLGMDTCEWAQPGKRAATAREIKALFPKITQLIDDLRTTYVGTPIVLVGYPSVINSQADSHCGALVGALLDRDERQFMNESITYLNHVMKAAAQYESIQFVDIQEALNGERLCDEQADAMNGIRIGDDIAPLSFLENIKVIGAESFHPTPRGHQLVAEHIEATLPTPLAAMGCNGCMYEAQLLIPSNYWNEPEASDTSLFQQVA